MVLKCRQYYKVKNCRTKKSNFKCSFLYSGSNNNARIKNTRANIYNIKPKTEDEKEKFTNSKQKYMQNTGSMYSLLKKKYNLTKENKNNYYDPTEKKRNKNLGKKNSYFKTNGKPIQNPSLGGSSAISRAIQRRIASNNNLIN